MALHDCTCLPIIHLFAECKQMLIEIGRQSLGCATHLLANVKPIDAQACTIVQSNCVLQITVSWWKSSLVHSLFCWAKRELNPRLRASETRALLHWATSPFDSRGWPSKPLVFIIYKELQFSQIRCLSSFARDGIADLDQLHWSLTHKCNGTA